MAQYVKNKDLLTEIIKSKEKGELTPKAVEMLMKMSREISKVFKYKHEEDREDCIAYSLEDVMKYWRNFDPAKSSNAFAYYTQMIKNGAAKGWRELYPIKASKKVPISTDNGVFNF
jgi:DNA-directed RNA polymerase specialized sigma subunit